ncbi:MAG: hypothetical protein GXP37_05180 [Chloroflexi bacterium]|nr:hypothetical protein [Chloroflexota bacterium]
MKKSAYIVIGHTHETPYKVWVVMIYAREDVAQEHCQKAAAEAKRIHANIKRAVMLRGKPFTQPELERFWANNPYDPDMNLSASGATYECIQAPLATGLILQSQEAAAT